MNSHQISVHLQSITVNTSLAENEAAKRTEQGNWNGSVHKVIGSFFSKGRSTRGAPKLRNHLEPEIDLFLYTKISVENTVCKEIKTLFE